MIFFINYARLSSTYRERVSTTSRVYRSVYPNALDDGFSRSLRPLEGDTVRPVRVSSLASSVNNGAPTGNAIWPVSWVQSSSGWTGVDSVARPGHDYGLSGPTPSPWSDFDMPPEEGQ